MKGFIVDATYRVIGGRAYVALFGRSEDHEAFLTLNYFKPYFFIKEKDLKSAQEFDEFEFEEVKLKTFDGEKVVKVYGDIPSDVVKFRKELEGEKIKTYEADIKFAQRFLIDNKIQGAIEVKGDYEYQEGIKVFRDPEIQNCESKVKLKVLSIDIETEKNAKEIYCISVVMEDYKKVLIVAEESLKFAEHFKTEKDMLERLFVLLKELDPDVITGWNVIDFDLKVIQRRCKKLEVPFVLGRVNNPSRLIIKESFFESSKVIAEGRQVIDLMAWVKINLKLSDYKLETAAQHYVGEGKNVQFGDKGDEIQKLFLKDKQKLIYYNLKDSELVLNILKKSNLLELYVKRSLVTGLMLDNPRGSIAALDSIYLKKLRDKGYVAPTIEHNVKEEPITGAYVMESKPGLYEGIVVLDFKSLYPSIMRTFNIDPITFGKKGIKAPNGATFSKEEGLMPEIIEHLLEVREEYKKNKDETGRYAIKILLNSFYGAMASPMCRYFNLELANAITGFARFFIKKMASWIREEGYEVIYSDTDSVFVVAKDDPKKLGKELENKMNKILEDYVKDEYNVVNHMYLEFDKAYTKFLMPRLRGEEKGAKKRYAGLIDGKLDITGMEAVRGDWTPLAKKFQEDLLMRVFTGRKVEDFIFNFIKDLKAGKFDELLVYKKGLQKSLDEYTKTTPPHVKAARKLKNFKGHYVRYVYTTEGVEPIEQVKGKFDYEHYINKQVKPIADTILAFLNLKFEDMISGQRSLKGF
ncbi:DNA polymerase II [Candidatus Woesearchaeota archaeon]|nr:DNA polymerase II [Candidatus Woesearchaeota archaeon]